MGLHSKALFWGAHLTPGPTGSTPPNGGISFENWAGASKQKLLLAVGLQRKFLFLRVHLTPGPTGFTHSKGGICSSLFRSLETCPSRSCFNFDLYAGFQFWTKSGQYFVNSTYMRIDLYASIYGRLILTR